MPFDGYWGEQSSIERVEFKVIPDSQTRASLDDLQASRLDVGEAGFDDEPRDVLRPFQVEQGEVLDEVGVTLDPGLIPGVLAVLVGVPAVSEPVAVDDDERAAGPQQAPGGAQRRRRVLERPEHAAAQRLATASTLASAPGGSAASPFSKVTSTFRSRALARTSAGLFSPRSTPRTV